MDSEGFENKGHCFGPKDKESILDLNILGNLMKQKHYEMYILLNMQLGFMFIL